MDVTDDHRVQSLRLAIERHEASDPAEVRSRSRFLLELDRLERPLDEHADPVHVTGSAIVTDGAGRVVLHRHKRLGVWLQPGGHLHPDEDPATAAVRETREETGLRAQHPPGEVAPLHLDVHPGPRDHLHLDVRYLLVVPAEGAAVAAFAPGRGESRAVAWFSGAEAVAVGDASLASAVRAMGARIRTAADADPLHRASGSGRPPPT